MEEENIVAESVVVDDEKELDDMIAATAQAVTEGGVPPKSTEIPVVKTDTVVEVPTAEGTTQGTENQPNDQVQYDLKVPVRGKFESEESYAVRTNIAEMIKAKEAAGTDSEKAVISEELKNFRKEFGHLINNNRSQLSTYDNSTPSDVTSDDDDQATPVSLEDVDAYFNQRMQAQENKLVTETFFNKYPEFTDTNVRDVFIDFFDSNYKIEGKTGGQLRQVLELARDAMFKPNQSIQERVLKGANVQEKVNAMQFPGGTIVRPGLTPDQQRSVDEMVSTGLMSEDQARKIILED